MKQGFLCFLLVLALVQVYARSAAEQGLLESADVDAEVDRIDEEDMEDNSKVNW